MCLGQVNAYCCLVSIGLWIGLTCFKWLLHPILQFVVCCFAIVFIVDDFAACCGTSDNLVILWHD